MKNAVINIKVDQDAKMMAETVFKQIGMSTSTAINIFLHAVAKNSGIPFALKAKIPNNETIRAINELVKDRKSKTLKSFNSVEELFEDLDD